MFFFLTHLIINLQNLTTVLIMTAILPTRKSKLFTILFYVLPLLPLGYLKFTTTITGLAEYIGYFGILWIFITLLYCTNTSFKKKLLVLLSYLIIMLICDLLCYPIILSIKGTLLPAELIDFSTPIYTLCLLINWLIYILLGSIWIYGYRYTLATKEPSKLIMFLIFPCSQFLFLFTLMRASYELLATNMTLLFLMISSIIIGLLADIYLVVLLGNQIKKEELEREVIALNHLHELEALHYDAIEEKRDYFARLRHDINNQLTTISSLIATGNAEDGVQMVHMLQEQFKETVETPYCGDSVINAVLAEKTRFCEANHIPLHIDLNFGSIKGIHKVHLCSIFSNLLDNAIKASLELDESNRDIALKGTCKGNYLTVHVTNTSNPPPKTSTRKGRGLLILKDIATQYEGYHESVYKEGYFTSYITVLDTTP